MHGPHNVNGSFLFYFSVVLDVFQQTQITYSVGRNHYAVSVLVTKVGVQRPPSYCVVSGQHEELCGHDGPGHMACWQVSAGAGRCVGQVRSLQWSPWWSPLGGGTITVRPPDGSSGILAVVASQ